MEIEVHADDLGASRAVNRNFFECHDRGVLESASLLVTTDAVEDAFSGVRVRPNLGLSLHLDLFEGQCRTQQHEVPSLTREDGFFNTKPSSLVRAYLFASRHQKEELSRQITRELTAQFEFYFSYELGQKNRRIDSHLHFHVLPFVWPIVEDLCRRHAVARVRMPHTFYFLDGFGTEPWWARCIKAATLTLLSRWQKHRLPSNTPSCVVTGVVSAPAFRTLASRLPENEFIEILFHPGFWSPEGDQTMRPDNPFREVYTSHTRHLESEVLRSQDFTELLRQLRAR